jgi:predicted RNA binding protein YcfA (HicA-like mRNA interferase family)
MIMHSGNSDGPFSEEPLDDFYREFPDVFVPREDPQMDDDFLPVPVDDPDRFDPVPVTDAPFDGVIDLPRGDEITADDIEELGAEAVERGDCPLPELPKDLIDRLGGASIGGHGGGLMPVPPTGPSLPVPPPDCLAFYLPFHFYFPGLWGVYLVYEGVLWLASYIYNASQGSVNGKQAIQIARRFLYYHEAFHHRTECLSMRMEITHRVPAYTRGFVPLYQRTFGSDKCIEEALANAHALRKSTWGIRKTHMPVIHALETLIRNSPPGYRLGVNYYHKTRFDCLCAEFAEENQREAFPRLPHKNPAAWLATTQMFTGINNIKGKVNYLIPRNSPILRRVRIQPLLPPKKIIQKLDRLVGVTFKRNGGNHDIYVTSSGNSFPMPRHAKDLGRGLLKKIIKESGLDMGLEEFLRA